jgi:hypothetical protein
MSDSVTIPANIFPYLRAGSLAEQDAAVAELTRSKSAATGRWKAHNDLLDLIGRTDDDNREAVEISLAKGTHLWAIHAALERFERDDPGAGASEIEAFRRGIGLPFERW